MSGTQILQEFEESIFGKKERSGQMFLSFALWAMFLSRRLKLILRIKGNGKREQDGHQGI